MPGPVFAADTSAMVVAALSGSAVVLAAVIPATLAFVVDSRRTKAELAAARQATADVASRIGEPNGAGDVVQMLGEISSSVATVVRGQAGQDNRIARLERDTHATTRRVDRHDVRLDGLERRAAGQ